MASLLPAPGAAFALGPQLAAPLRPPAAVRPPVATAAEPQAEGFRRHAAAAVSAALCWAGTTRRHRRRFGRRAAAVPQWPSDGDQDGACSIWHGGTQGPKRIDERFLKQKWTPDMVRNLDEQYVRSCRKGVKQVATIGPACSSRETIESLFLCGVDVFRVDVWQYDKHEELLRIVGHIRDVENEYKHPIGVLAQLKGPKFTCGEFNDGKGGKSEKGPVLPVGTGFRFDVSKELGDSRRVQANELMITGLSRGKHLVVDDGRLKMKVKHIGYTLKGKDTYVDSFGAPRPADGKPFVECEVLVGDEEIRPGADMDAPDSLLNISAITPDDRRDITFLCEQGAADWIALGFLQGPGDLEVAEEIVRRSGGHRPKLLATIARPSAVERVEEILGLGACSGIIVAPRGNQGGEVKPEQAPYIQKDIIAKAKEAAKTVIVATQMQESTVEKDTATTAERSYMASAILDGCDALMFGRETAAGKYPLECVERQRRIIDFGEHTLKSRPPSANTPRRRRSAAGGSAKWTTLPIVATAKTLVQEMDAKAVICFSETGRSVVQLVKKGVNVPILAVSPCPETARWLSLLRGVYAMNDEKMQKLAGTVQKDNQGFSIRFSEAVEEACRMLRESGMVNNADDWVVVIGRSPLFTLGENNEHNSLQLTRAKGPQATVGVNPTGPQATVGVNPTGR